MKRLALILLLLTSCVTAFARQSQLQKATNIVNEIMGTPDKGIPQNLLDKAVCVGIVPSEVKVAWVFGGTYGRGLMVCRTSVNGEWGAPSMFSMGGVSVGWQIGGKETDVVFRVMNTEGMKKFVQDSVKLGTEVSITKSRTTFWELTHPIPGVPSATRKLGFRLWFAATANWERGTSFTCKRRAAQRIDKKKPCELQITQQLGLRWLRRRSVGRPGPEWNRVPQFSQPGDGVLRPQPHTCLAPIPVPKEVREPPAF
jgi:hypothetical protein